METRRCAGLILPREVFPLGVLLVLEELNVDRGCAWEDPTDWNRGEVEKNGGREATPTRDQTHGSLLDEERKQDAVGSDGGDYVGTVEFHLALALSESDEDGGGGNPFELIGEHGDERSLCLGGQMAPVASFRIGS